MMKPTNETRCLWPWGLNENFKGYGLEYCSAFSIIIIADVGVNLIRICDATGGVNL